MAAAVEELPVQPRSVAGLTRELLKRTHTLFAANESQRPELDEPRCAPDATACDGMRRHCPAVHSFRTPKSPLLAQREEEALSEGAARHLL